MIKHYERTQVGYVIMVALAAGLLLVVRLMITNGFKPVTLGVSILLVGSLIVFSSLKVIIWDDVLEIQFGPGPIRKKFPLSEIVSCQTVKIPWYYGWGVRLTPRGWLYRVSGFQAVEVLMKTGKRYLIGSDAPGEIEEAIQRTKKVKRF
ncbi:MAG: hypothetical protein ABIB93_06280 [Chloroflexota bacterium]